MIVHDRGVQIVKQFRQYRWSPKEEGGRHGKQSKHIEGQWSHDPHRTTLKLMVKGGT